MRHIITLLIVISLLGVHYCAWVEDMIFFQVVDGIILVFAMIGACSNEMYATTYEESDAQYWIINTTITLLSSWCFFGEGHTGAFYGSLYILCFVTTILGALHYGYTKKQKDKTEDTGN